MAGFRFIGISGKKEERKYSFKDVEPFVEKERTLLATQALRLLVTIMKQVKEGKTVERDVFVIFEKLREHGVLLHPLSSQLCVQMDAQKLSIAGVPFQVYFSIFSGKETMGGTYFNNNDRSKAFVYLSVSCIIRLLSNYIAVNDEKNMRLMKAAEKSLLRMIQAGPQRTIHDEEVTKMALHLAQGRLLQAEMNRHKPSESKGWMGLVDSVLANVAIHEGAHVLHDAAGIIGSGGLHKEEERAYLTEMAFGIAGFMLTFLPKKEGKDPNNQAGFEIMKKIKSRIDTDKILLATEKEISAIGNELLDKEFMESFGKHHDQIIPTIEIHRIKKHRFFIDKDLPMFDNLKPIDDGKGEKEEKKAA